MMYFGLFLVIRLVYLLDFVIDDDGYFIFKIDSLISSFLSHILFITFLSFTLLENNMLF